MLTENSQDPFALYALARINFKRQDYEQAIERFKQTIYINPNFVEAYSYDGGLPEVYRAKRDLDRGIQYLAQPIQTNPKNANAYYGLVRCQ